MNVKKKNFYFRTQGYNNESVELYVGQSSGKQLNYDIINAEKEVLIISPYIDESKLDDLIKLKNKGVNIRLAFSDLRNDQKFQILRKLIHQQKDTNESLKKRVKTKAFNFFIVSITSLVIGIILILFSILNYTIINVIFIIQIIIGILGLYGFYKLNILKNKIEKTEIYSYEYFEKINFKYLKNNFRSYNKMFIHSKIYIIDRKIAYIGSLNYTNNGFTSNFETRIRITQFEKIKELIQFVHNIFDDEYNFKSHKLSFLGKQVYSEEKY